MKKKYKSRLWTATVASLSFLSIFVLTQKNPPQRASFTIVQR